MNGALLLIKSLEDQGVKHIFGIPGNHVLGLYDAFRESSIEHILGTHEPSIGFMADAYGRVTREPGVVVVTAGPGVLNLVNPTAQAYSESSPMVIIAAQCDMNKWGKGCYHELEHPEAQMSIFQDITKWQTRITKAEEIPIKISEAFFQSKYGRHRPVYVEIPENIFYQEANYKKSDLKKYRHKKINKSTIDKIIQALLSSNFPVIFAGGGIVSSGASQELLRLAELLEIPIATTLMGKGSICEDHSLSLGYGTGKIGTPSAIDAIDRADLMLAIGCRFDEVATGFFTLKPPERIIHIDIDPEELNKNYPAYIAVIGDAKTILSQINGEIVKKGLRNDNVRKKNILKQNKYQSKNLQLLESTNGVHPFNLIINIKRLIDDGIIISDAGNSALWAWEYPISSELLITPAGYNSMGFSIPAAISAKLADPSRKVICFCGDGSFLMTGLEIVTAIRYNLDINVIILHDNRYNLLNFFQDINYESRYTDTTLYTFNFAKFANDIGALGLTIKDNKSITKQLKKGLAYTGPTLFDVYIDTDVKPPFLTKLSELMNIVKK